MKKPRLLTSNMIKVFFLDETGWGRAGKTILVIDLVILILIVLIFVFDEQLANWIDERREDLFEFFKQLH